MAGTRGIAELVDDALTDAGFQVDVRPASEVSGLDPCDAVVIGVQQWAAERRSGRRDPARATVQQLLDRIGARGHVTFGGRLPTDAKGSRPARWPRPHAGDWRDPERIRGWAADVAMELLPLDRLGQLHA